MSHVKFKLKRKHGSFLKGFTAFSTQSHLFLLAKIVNKDKTIAILFGRIRYCRYLFDSEITKENYIRNWYLVRHSLDKLIVIITAMNGTKYAIKLLNSLIEIYSNSERNIKSELSDAELLDEWLLMKKSLSELLISEPDESKPHAQRHLRMIQQDETQFFKINYFKLL